MLQFFKKHTKGCISWVGNFFTWISYIFNIPHLAAFSVSTELQLKYMDGGSDHTGCHLAKICRFPWWLFSAKGNVDFWFSYYFVILYLYNCVLEHYPTLYVAFVVAFVVCIVRKLIAAPSSVCSAASLASPALHPSCLRRNGGILKLFCVSKITWI